MSTCCSGGYDVTEFLTSCHKAIMAQSTGIPDTLKSVDKRAVEDLCDKQRVVLVGCGDSYAVAEYGKWVFMQAGINALVLSALELERIAVDENSVVIGISASGRSIASVTALKHAKKRGALSVALTDNANGVITESADRVWLTRSNVESYDISPSSPTTAAMAYLLKLGGLLVSSKQLKTEVDILSQQSNAMLDWADRIGRKIAEILPARGNLYLVSDGPNYVAGMVGMMKFNEYSLIKGVAALKEEFAHHWILSITEKEHAILVTDNPSAQGDDEYLRVMTDKIGMTVFHLRTDMSLQLKTPYGQTIANSIALQMTAYHHVIKHEPNKEDWKRPHAGAFKIY